MSRGPFQPKRRLRKRTISEDLCTLCTSVPYYEGALRLFGLHFVKQGAFEAKDSHLFSKLMKYRQEADYNPSYMFTPEDYIEFKEEVVIVIQKITTRLKEEGYLI